MSSVLLDVQGTQSVDHRDRGVARYVHQLALALEEVAPGRVGAFLLNPDLTLPGGVEPLAATGRLRRSDDSDVPWDEARLLHVASPFELSVPLRRLLPPPAVERDLPVVVTLYDLIPEVLASDYLADPGLRRRYRARQHLVRSARAVLALSQATRRDAIERLGLSPERVSVVGAGTDPRFVPPLSRPEAATAAAAVPGLRPPFVLYTGGTDGRKNVDRLLEAWSRLPAGVRDRWQLVVACSLAPLERNHLEVLAARFGLGPGDLALPGYVPDDVLVLLYQGADLFVFPSLYEGYGLPVAEALACGAPVLAARAAALPELVPPEALFDPTDAGAMAGALERALTDAGLRRRLLSASGRPPATWAEVARSTVEAYDAVLDRPPPRRPRPRSRARRRLAFASPLPPIPSGVADYSYRLLDELRQRADVSAFSDGPPDTRPALTRTSSAAELAGSGRRFGARALAPPGVPVHPVTALERVEAIEGPFDAVVYCLGNSEFHTGALASLRRRPGVVLAHDVRLTNLYGFGPHQHPRSVPDGFQAALHAMYPGALPPGLGASGWLEPGEAERYGILMAREVLGLAERFLVTSEFAAGLARLDALPADRSKIAVVPFALGMVAEPLDRGAGRTSLVATFGVVNPAKQTAKVLDAFATVAGALPEATLAVVGPCGVAEAAGLRARALEHGLRVEITGEVPDDAYREWLGRAGVAVQLRAATNGESSAAVGDCLASGLPTVVSALGAARELPDEAVVKVDVDVGTEELGKLIVDLLTDEGRRAALSRAASALAAERSFAKVAEALYEVLLPSG